MNDRFSVEVWTDGKS